MSDTVMATLNQSGGKQKKSPSPMRSIGHFMRTATLITGLVVVPYLLKAQIVQVLYPKDTVSASIVRSAYISEKKKDNEVPAKVEFAGAFIVYINKNPKQELKIMDDLILSKNDQKNLRKKPLLETDTHVLYYMFEVGGDYFGALYVYRKEESTPSPTAKSE